MNNHFLIRFEIAEIEQNISSDQIQNSSRGSGVEQVEITKVITK